MAKKLEEMISARAYDEIKRKLSACTGESAAELLFPMVKQALEEGDHDVRYNILIDWLECDTLRVCTQCGAIMQEGWYLNLAGYACSDECAAKSEGITMVEFDRYRIYKDDIIEWLEWNDDPRTIDELSKEECDSIIEEVAADKEYCYTEWY